MMRGLVATPLLLLFSVRSGRLLPGSSGSLIGRQSHPSDTGHVPPGKQTPLHDALDRNIADHITDAMLSSTKP